MVPWLFQDGLGTTPIMIGDVEQLAAVVDCLAAPEAERARLGVLTCHIWVPGFTARQP
jgi:hypothetical protein